MKDLMMSMVENYGYIAVFASMLLGIIGIPFPDEFLLLFVGSMAGAAKLNLYLLIVVAWLGSSAGMTVNYFLGRKIGIKRISRVTKWVHLTEDRLEGWAKRFRRFGPILIFIGFFVAGLRHASPFIAGASKMSFGRYAGYAYLGSLVWISIFVYVGRWVGPHFHHVLGLFHHPLWISAILTFLMSLLLIKKYCFASHHGFGTSERK
jgi:membrane protein DedA with SNARE-associated domain